MIARIADWMRPVLEFPLIRRTRRNHALEHATIHVLAGRTRNLRMAGRSSDSGFVLMGDVPTEQVERAVEDALRRMNEGESQLAIHPNCGTNLVTSGVMTTLAGYVGLRLGVKTVTYNRLSWTLSLMMAAILASQPIGMSIQKHITTDGQPGDLEIVKVTRREMRAPFLRRPITLHNVITRRG
jgi:hypothetical protein